MGTQLPSFIIDPGDIAELANIRDKDIVLLADKVSYKVVFIYRHVSHCLTKVLPPQGFRWILS